MSCWLVIRKHLNIIITLNHAFNVRHALSKKLIHLNFDTIIERFNHLEYYFWTSVRTKVETSSQ